MQIGQIAWEIFQVHYLSDFAYNILGIRRYLAHLKSNSNPTVFCKYLNNFRKGINIVLIRRYLAHLKSNSNPTVFCKYLNNFRKGINIVLIMLSVQPNT
ncbi:hypothetical protein QE152_g16076 [Popillia japonica]|uniref:Maturase K n=1 Tax=Popillia japonica TaxID=7064 RepID=A0AAW1L5Z5_POPJA